MGRWQHGPDNEDEAKKKLARVRSCMVILRELNMIDIGGWDQAQTLGKFDEVKGVWTYTNNTMLHNDRYEKAQKLPLYFIKLRLLYLKMTLNFSKSSGTHVF